MKYAPTPIQAKALDAIRTLTRQAGGVAPTYAEIASAIGLASRGQVHGLLHRMRDRGLIVFDDGCARSVRVVGEIEGLAMRTTPELVRLRASIEAILCNRGQA